VTSSIIIQPGNRHELTHTAPTLTGTGNESSFGGLPSVVGGLFSKEENNMTNRYKLRQRLISLGDDFKIENEHGQTVYNVDNKLLRIRDTFVITDKDDNEVATIRERILALRDTVDILRGGETMAVVRKAWFTPFRDKFTVDVKGGENLVAQGNLLDHEYEIRRDNEVIATISKRWFTFRDTYGISIEAGEDDGLILAIAVAIDEMVHDDVKPKQNDE
jgi:uncharacterized protein YxjI